MSKGYFVWHDVMTTDTEAALRFYQELLGWTTKTVDMEMGPYTMAAAAGIDVGGAVPLDPKDGLPPHWMTYISVDDIDAACKQIEELGGKVHQEPFEIPNVGKMAVASDPTGAYFSPYQDRNADDQPQLPSGVQPGGAVAWHEVSTDDQNATDDFYQALFGWGKIVWPMPGEDGGEYHGMTIGEAPVAGVFKRPPDVPAAWMIYFESAGTIEDAAANITRLGGSILREPFTVEGTGDILVAADPTGAVFGMMKSIPMDSQ